MSTHTLVFAMLLLGATMSGVAAVPRQNAPLPEAQGRSSISEALEDSLDTQQIFGHFKREGLPLAVLAETRHFRVAAGVSPRKVVGIYFVRKSVESAP